jgi:aminopeptidase N
MTTEAAPRTDVGLNVVEAAERSRVVSVETYDVHWDLTGLVDAETFGSRTTVTFACHDVSQGTWIDAVATEVVSVRLNGVDLDPAEVVTGDRVTLDHLAPHNTLELVARHADGRGRGLSRSVDDTDGSVYAWTQFEPYDARRAFACFDQPDLKASFRISATVPEEWTCISNSRATEQTGDGTVRHHVFAETPRLSTYVVAICAGPFHSVTSEVAGAIPVSVHARRSLAEAVDFHAPEIIGLTRAGLQHFDDQFGVGFAGDSYDYVFLADQPGAMENYGCVTWADQSLFRAEPTPAERSRFGFVLLHEMAHMWFGNLVTLKWWDSLWLNESFADWAGFWAAAELEGNDASWAHFLLTHKVRGYAADACPTTHPISVDIPDVEAAEAGFDMITYAKGAGVLRQLVAWVGQDAFLTGLRQYFTTYAWGNATLPDLLAELESASGRDLSGWVEQWLKTSGTNRLSVEAGVAEGRYAEVSIRQDGEPARAHRVRIGVYDESAQGLLEPRGAVELDVLATARTTVSELVGQPAGVLVLNDGDWAFAKVRYDDASLQALIAAAHTLPTTLGRAGAIIALRDLVIDGELEVASLVDATLWCVDVEADQATAAQLLGMCVDVTERFARRTDLAELLSRIATYADAARRRTRQDGLRQAFELAFADSATTEPQRDTLRAMLADGRTSQRVRWACLTRLAVFDEVSATQIDEEVVRDPDPDARLVADSVRAARPDPEAKRAALQAMLSLDRTPTATRELLSAGLWQASQEELLRPFAREYLELLPALASDPDVPLQGSLIKRTFPAFGPDESFVATARALAAEIDAPLMVRNGLRDETHHLDTMLAVRAGVRGRG